MTGGTVDQAAPIVIGSDHAGWELKEAVKAYLSGKGIPVTDVGEPAYDRLDDYPKYAFRVARSVAAGAYQRGIAVCGTGLGASMAANRVSGVRAALCITEEMAVMSRKHNDANVLVMGGRLIAKETAFAIVDAWLSTAFEGGRHETRIRQIDTQE